MVKRRNQAYEWLAEILAGDHEHLGALADELGVDLDRAWKAAQECYLIQGPSPRAVLLDMEPTRRLWREFVDDEGLLVTQKSEEILALLRRFPTLKHAVEAGDLGRLAKGWSPRELELWAYCSPAASSGGVHAAAFVLGVWDKAHAYACGRFDCHSAMAVWDEVHRRAFLDWVMAPWWA